MKCNCGFESNYFSNGIGDYDFETEQEYKEQVELEEEAHYNDDIFLFVKIPLLVHSRGIGMDYYFEEKELYMCPECNTLIVRVDE